MQLAVLVCKGDINAVACQVQRGGYVGKRVFHPLAAKGICGAGENLKRQEIKALMKSWDREFPGRIYNIFMSLTRVSPSHLMDQRLYDFRNFRFLLPDPSLQATEDE